MAGTDLNAEDVCRQIAREVKERNEDRENKGQGSTPQQKPSLSPFDAVRASGELSDSKRSLWVAYALLALFGYGGLHLIYLDRPMHAFLWCISGGWFGLGVARDFLTIPRYVEEANFVLGCSSDLFHMTTKYKVENMKKPPFRLVCFIAQIVCGQVFALAAQFMCPPGTPHLVSDLASGFGYCVGVWAAASAPRFQRVPLSAMLATAGVGWACRSAAFVATNGEGFEELYTVVWLTSFLLPLIAAWRYRAWRLERSNRLKCLVAVMGAVALFWGVCLAGVYNHGVLYGEDGEVRIADLLRDFPTSTLFQEFERCRSEPGGCFREFFSHVHDAFALEDTAAAYKALGLEEGASRAEVKGAYRALALQFHPDKCKACSEEEAAEHSRRFIEVQKAYEQLGGHSAEL